jgi:hypothetical protein
MANLRNLAPWAVFAVGSALADWRVAAPAALVVCVFNVVGRRRAGAATNEMAVAAMAFFGILTLVSGADPTSPVHDYLPALTAAAVGSGMLASILRGRPFTLEFAKRSTSPAIWDDPRFLRANVTISAVWACSVLATAAGLAVLHIAEPHAVIAAVAVQVAGFVVPMRFTKIYRGRLRARFAAA